MRWMQFLLVIAMSVLFFNNVAEASQVWLRGFETSSPSEAKIEIGLSEGASEGGGYFSVGVELTSQISQTLPIEAKLGPAVKAWSDDQNSGWLMAQKIEGNVIRVGMAGTSPLRCGEPFLRITYDVSSTTSREIPLEIHLQLNEEAIILNITVQLQAEGQKEEVGEAELTEPAEPATAVQTVSWGKLKAGFK